MIGSAYEEAIDFICLAAVGAVGCCAPRGQADREPPRGARWPARPAGGSPTAAWPGVRRRGERGGCGEKIEETQESSRRERGTEQQVDLRPVTCNCSEGGGCCLAWFAKTKKRFASFDTRFATSPASRPAGVGARAATGPRVEFVVVKRRGCCAFMRNQILIRKKEPWRTGEGRGGEGGGFAEEEHGRKGPGAAAGAEQADLVRLSRRAATRGQ